MTAKQSDQGYTYDDFSPTQLPDSGSFSYSFKSSYSSLDEGVGLQREDLERLRLHPLDYLNLTYEEVRDLLAAGGGFLNRGAEHPQPNVVVEAPPNR